VTADECVGLALRSPARDRDAHAAVVFDAEQVSSCATMTNKVDGGTCAIAWRFEASDACRCNRAVASRCELLDGESEWQAELHDPQDTRFAFAIAPGQPDVSFV
jgi:hypothetical protein